MGLCAQLGATQRCVGLPLGPNGAWLASLAMKTLFLLAAFLVLACPAFAQLPGAETLAGLVIQQFDKDHDGNVDINEWQNGALDGFVQMDRDEDGFISDSELDALTDELADEVGKLGAVACVALIKKILFTFDTDKDGRISKAEYEAGCAKLFKMLDANHDGIVTKAELADLPLKLFSRGG
jgi:Ca2+-binding EF-hand superfamily protein